MSDSLLPCQMDAYRRSLQTEVLRCEEEGETFQVELAESPFFPEGGGQPADRGRIGEAVVLDVQKDGERVFHRTDRAVGEGEVLAEIDWPRRFDHMQQHTAQHLITALAQDRWGLATWAFHLGAASCFIDLEAEAIPAATLAALQASVNEEIRAARPVEWRQVQPEELDRLTLRTRGLPEGHAGAVRLVEIEGLDLNNCGGTHVASTAEIQLVHFLGTERARGRIRLFYLAGGRITNRLSTSLQREAALKEALSAGPDEWVEVATKLRSEGAAAAKERKRLLGELATHVGRELTADSGAVIAGHRPEADLGFLGAVANAARGARPESLVLLAGGDREGVVLLLAPEEGGAELFQALCAVLEVRGGGSKGRYQGKATRLDRFADAVEAAQRWALQQVD